MARGALMVHIHCAICSLPPLFLRITNWMWRIAEMSRVGSPSFFPSPIGLVQLPSARPPLQSQLTQVHRGVPTIGYEHKFLQNSSLALESVALGIEIRRGTSLEPERGTGITIKRRRKRKTSSISPIYSFNAPGCKELLRIEDQPYTLGRYMVVPPATGRYLLATPG